MLGLEILTAAAGLMIGLGALEQALHHRRLKQIPTRIHVSGTRGKSSVTRLIAAGLRGGGIRAAAKTTGTLARMIMANGREFPVFRPAGANIIEQTRIVATAQESGIQALVLECMALQPELHWLAESKLVRATHGVITNARADHLDVMGPTEADVAKTLAGMIPVNGMLFTAEQRHLPIIRSACKDRKTQLIAIKDDDVARITDEQLSRFRYTEHAENVALALAITDSLNVDRDVALRGMEESPPDPGALTEYHLDFFGRHIIFANAFAANDPESTRRIWSMMRKRYEDCDKIIAVFNLRADRVNRTTQLAQSANVWREADHVLLIGGGTYQFGRTAAKAGLDPSRVGYAENASIDEIFESIVDQCGKRTLVIGMGNVAGPGLALTRYFRNRARMEGS